MSDWKIRGKPALLILHMQQGIVGEKGNVPGLSDDVKVSGIIPRQQALLKAFREKKLPVVYVNALHVTGQQNPTGVLPAYGLLFKMIEEAKFNPGNLEVIPEVTPQPGEPVLINWLLGAFTNSGLDEVLKANDVETLVVAGCATHIAVYTAAVQAADRWYSVVIPGDASCSPKAGAAAEKIVLDIMAPMVALVTTTEDVIAHLP